MTTFTREDYEMAAKAAGIVLDFTIRGDFPPYYVNERGGHSSWNPPEDDGDALRLAVKLRLQIDVMPNDEVFVGYGPHAKSNLQRMRELREQDVNPLSATRRAIFRAAIAIGREMP